VADLSLDRHLLQEIVRNKRYGLGTGGPWPAGRRCPIRSASAGSRGCCQSPVPPYSIGVAVIRRRPCGCACERWPPHGSDSGIGD
jgi:hypothetical protein